MNVMGWMVTGSSRVLGRALLEHNVPVDHLAFYIRALNPTFFGRSIIWSPGGPVTSVDLAHGEDVSRRVRQSPVGHVTSTREWLVLHPDDRRWGPSERLFKGGLTELCIAPMVHGPDEYSINAITFGTRKQRGFSEGDLGLFRRILPAIRGAVELKIWPRKTASILGTYIGADPEKRIMSGRIRRGDVETVETAIMFCDLHGFTQLSNHLSSARVLVLLNIYFDQVVPSVMEFGGEVLKFMGDGLLAMFRIDGNAERSCAAALEAAHAICRRLQGGSPAGC